ncbi:MAG: pyruvate kinase, partial [Epsilonproteobacteria bacterium]|nr:pyruvate kinase [Campylobacterota bacterium]
MDKKTKILATVGPASDSVEVLEDLIKAGVNVFRLNFSHGTHEYHTKVLKNIRI